MTIYSIFLKYRSVILEMEHAIYSVARLYWSFVVDIEGRTEHDGLHGAPRKKFEKACDFDALKGL